jgi:hypothetical protein
VGRDSCWLIQPRSGPRPAGRGRRETAHRRGGDQSGGPPGAKRSPVHWETRGPSRPPARRGYPNNFRANRPDPRAEGLTGTPTPRRSPLVSSTVSKRPTASHHLVGRIVGSASAPPAVVRRPEIGVGFIHGHDRSSWRRPSTTTTRCSGRVQSTPSTNSLRAPVSSTTCSSMISASSGRGFELGKGAVEGAGACRRRIAQELGVQGSYRSAGTSAGVAGLAASVASRWAVGHWTLVAHPAFSKRRMIPAEESICPRPTPCRAEAG